MKINRSLTLALAGGSLLGLPLFAQWTVVTDFEGVTSEDLNRYFQYPGFGTFYVVPGLDPEDPANTVMYLDAEERGVRCNRLHVAVPLPQPVEVGTVATLKFDFYQYGSSFDLNVGLSPTPIEIDEETGLMVNPNSFADFEAQVRVNTPLDVRDGNNFRPTTVSPAVGEWITFYLVINHVNQTVEGHVRRADGTLERLLIPMPDETQKDNWLFRVGRQEPLVSFYVGSSNACDRGYDLGDIWLIDNIYIDTSGRNLDDGTPTDRDPGFYEDTLLVSYYYLSDGWALWYPVSQSVTSFGTIYIDHVGAGATAGWVYHFERGAWLYVTGTTGDGLFAYSTEFDSWIYILFDSRALFHVFPDSEHPEGRWLPWNS